MNVILERKKYRAKGCIKNYFYSAFESIINILSWIIYSLDLKFFFYLDNLC